MPAHNQFTPRGKRILYPGCRRKPQPIRAAHPAIRTLWETLHERQDVTLRSVAQRSGVDVRTMRSWRLGKSARVADLEAVLNAIGLKIVVIHVDNVQ